VFLLIGKKQIDYYIKTHMRYTPHKEKEVYKSLNVPTLFLIFQNMSLYGRSDINISGISFSYTEVLL
jgi:hypothetical protein